MLITNKRLVRPNAPLESKEWHEAALYILGAVHGFCNAFPGKSFSVRSLVGGGNADWSGTPIQKIYESHCRTLAPEQAADRAAEDTGRLLKAVLQEDKYTYEEEKESARTCWYRRIE